MRKVLGGAFIVALSVWAGSGLAWVLDNPEFRDTVVFKSGVIALFLLGVIAVVNGGKK